MRPGKLTSWIFSPFFSASVLRVFAVDSSVCVCFFNSLFRSLVAPPVRPHVPSSFWRRTAHPPTPFPLPLARHMTHCTRMTRRGRTRSHCGAGTPTDVPARARAPRRRRGGSGKSGVRAWEQLCAGLAIGPAVVMSRARCGRTRAGGCRMDGWWLGSAHPGTTDGYGSWFGGFERPIMHPAKHQATNYYFIQCTNRRDQ